MYFWKLTVAVCEDYGPRVILMLSTCLALNKMHYSVLPRHLGLHYSILMSYYCCVMFDLALALVLVLSI